MNLTRFKGLNFKEGLKRLFIISNVIAVILGISDAIEPLNNHTSFMIRAEIGLKNEIKIPNCRDRINKNIIDLPNSSRSLEDPCRDLQIHWRSLNEFKNKNIKKYPDIDESLVDAYATNERSQYKWELYLTLIFISLVKNALLWAGIFALARVAIWLYRGFKSTR